MRPILNEQIKQIICAEYVIDEEINYQPLLNLIDKIDDQNFRNQIKDELLFAQVHTLNLGVDAGYAAAVNPRSIMESEKYE